MKHIAILTTGGTIDKIYFDAKSSYEVGPPNIERVLKELTLSITYSVTPLMRKDSLEITTQDRDVILAAVEAEDSSMIIITHGTDTMVETGKSLKSVKNKTIILTGALEPALFKTSDALFNIGCALSAAQSLQPGIYIAMNGTVFSYDNVWKNLEKNRFEALS